MLLGKEVNKALKALSTNKLAPLKPIKPSFIFKPQTQSRNANIGPTDDMVESIKTLVTEGV